MRYRQIKTRCMATATTQIFFLLTLLKVRFEGKRDSIWKLKISTWKDFEKSNIASRKAFRSKCTLIFQNQISRNCPEKILLSNFFQFCQNAFKTKISLEEHFRKKMDSTEFLLLLPTKKNFPETCS